ncbi:MAG TPA: DUF3592 domain-containing protein [Longimicrobium sp.]|nr:DUF3592 domain-containing protein [Longimicrobium sp.]
MLLIVWAIAGVSLLGPLLHHRANLKARDWPATPGEVVRFDRRLHDGVRGEVCTIRLRYRYSVGGREYFSRRLWFGGTTGCFDPHVPELGAGQQVRVAYDPRRPRTSVLVRSHPLHQGDIYLAAICVVPAVALLLYGLLKQRQGQVDARTDTLPAAEPGAAAGSGLDNVPV